MAIDTDRLQDFLHKFVGDLGATVAAGNVVIGHNLGLYKALSEGPATADELAGRTHTSERYVAEWLRGQAAGGYVQYDGASDSYSMTEEQAFVLTDPDGAVYAPGAFVLALGALKAEPRITEAFRTGGGLGWHEHDNDVFIGCEAFFRPGYIANLIPSWIPSLTGVHDKLTAGATVADLGCGLGASTILLAREYPNSRFTGSDYHAGRSSSLASGPETPAWLTGSTSRWRRQPDSPAATTTWSPPSTACMTWATPWPPPGTSGKRSSQTAPGWSSSLPRPMTRPAT